MRGIWLIVLAVLIGSVGQIVMKIGMRSYGKLTVIDVWRQLVPVLTTPQVALGFLCHAVSAILWVVVLSNVDVSMAYPMVSLGYVMVVIVSWLFLGESVGLLRTGGLLLIIGGVVLISRS